MDRALIQQILALLPIFINSAIINCANSWMSNAVYFLTLPNHSPSATVAECGLMASFYHIGRLAFAVPSGVWADKYGIKYIIITIGFINIATWVTLSITHSVWMILAVRFFQGCAAALSNSCGSKTIGEICYPKYRGFFFGLQKCISTLGNIAEGVLASVFSSYSISVYVTTILALLFFPAIPWITESPYYLVGASKYEESKRTLAKIRRGQPESEISAEYESLKQFVEKEESIKSGYSWLQYLAMPSTRKPLICCILLNILVVSNGTNVIFLYAAVIFPPNQYFSNNSYPLMLSLIQLVSSVGTALLLDAMPRRHLFMLTGFLSFLIQSSNGIVYYEYSIAVDENQRNILKWTFLAGVLAFYSLSNAVLTPLSLVLKTEILPLSIRGLGNSICLICQALSAVLCFQLFTFIQTYYGTAANYSFFAVNSLLIVLVAYFFVPETRGKTLAEVQEISRQDGKFKETAADSNDERSNNVQQWCPE